MSKKRGLLTQELLHPQFEVARERTQELMKTFRIDEVIKMLDELIEEVRSMPIANRFRSDQRIFSKIPSAYTVLNPILEGMSEQDHKRWQLERDLSEIRNQIVILGPKFKTVLMDIEATKIDG